ncbi:hypothetical protein CDAR_258781 [Caerostris darwini]|uniref:Uncharacterized protein n=1 Tax=Caerostris darwini TaxID=1538125 RepID=A0AAV4U852_9ARAC|nr:hypothetical protein CDAR_258781 [Caerostris darwini]
MGEHVIIIKINNVDQHNLIPLYYACWKESIRCVELLLKMGANIHTSQSDREPLHEACQHDKLECAEMLLRYGSNEVQNARHCSSKLAQILLQKILRRLHHFMQPRLEITQFDNQNKLSVDLLPENERDLFDLSVQYAAEPVLLKDLCHRTIRATLDQSSSMLSKVIVA